MFFRTHSFINLAKLPADIGTRFRMLKFPQFYRIFSAQPLFLAFRGAIILAVLTLFGLNVRAVSQPAGNEVRLLTRRVISYPFRAQTHVDLAKAYWEKRLLSLAQKELSIAGDLLTMPPAGNTPVLGTTSEPETLSIEWESFQHQLQGKYDAWATVIATYPDYRDGHLSFSTIAYQLGYMESAQRAIEVAAELDPNFPPTQSLRTFLSQNR